MDLTDRTVLILGGAGLVGRAVARSVLPHGPGRLILGSLRQEEVVEAVAELQPLAGGIPVEAVWGDLFVPEVDRDRPRGDLLADPERRAALVDDLYGELTADVVARSALGALLLDARPEIVVDCINTAGALAYRDAFRSAAELRQDAAEGGASLEAVERHLATLYLPQLIRHTQIVLSAMREVGTKVFVKIGTAGTGGMGLNIPFTHSEERPSRVLLAKSSLAGAQTLLLYLMARTPGAPAVKEIKPTAAISWKSIGHGTVHRGGAPIKRVDAQGPVSVARAFNGNTDGLFSEIEGPISGVYLDAGENGLFTLEEFETLTALGLMEYVTPEEIAQNVIREIQGHPSGKDVVAALDAATMGPTYRAGVLRSAALDRMAALEEEHGVRSVAYEMLGPPRLSKLLFEAHVLERLGLSLDDAAALDAADVAERARSLFEADADLRQRVLSIGLPILMPDGEECLRGPEVRVPPENGRVDERTLDRGWVDLRPENWIHWRERAQRMVAERDVRPGVDSGSTADHDFRGGSGCLRPAHMAAWIFRTEDSGERIKR